jgi:putative hydrolase of HD superfamily
VRFLPDFKEIVKYLFEAGQLSEVKRSGDLLIGIDNPQTVAEHSFRGAVVAFILGKMEGVNAEKAALTVLFHDIPETRIGDIHKVGQRYIDSKAAEKKAFEEQVAPLPEEIKKGIKGFDYSNGDSSPEGVVARDADLIECALQYREYLVKGNKDAQDWLNNIRKIVRTKTAKKLLDEIEKSDPRAWWKGLKKIER